MYSNTTNKSSSLPPHTHSLLVLVYYRFTGKEDDIKRLKKVILRKHLVNNLYSFECTIKDQTLKLEAAFRPGKQVSIVVTLKEAIKYTDKKPVPFE
jgi:hypothetical protein